MAAAARRGRGGHLENAGEVAVAHADQARHRTASLVADEQAEIRLDAR